MVVTESAIWSIYRRCKVFGAWCRRAARNTIGAGLAATVLEDFDLKGSFLRVWIGNLVLSNLNWTRSHSPTIAWVMLELKEFFGEKEIINKQVKQWLDDGIIKESYSDFAAPVVMTSRVRKKMDLSDYRFRIPENKSKLIKDRYPLSLIELQSFLGFTSGSSSRAKRKSPNL